MEHLFRICMPTTTREIESVRNFTFVGKFPGMQLLKADLRGNVSLTAHSHGAITMSSDILAIVYTVCNNNMIWSIPYTALYGISSATTSFRVVGRGEVIMYGTTFGTVNNSLIISGRGSISGSSTMLAEGHGETKSSEGLISGSSTFILSAYGDSTPSEIVMSGCSTFVSSACVVALA